MIVTAVDYTYLQREGIYLIKSCWKHAPEQRFYLYLVNAPSEVDTEIRRWHGNIIIEHVNYPVDKATWKGVMCCARTIPLKHVMQTYSEPTVYLDSDVILKQPLTPLLKLLEHKDLLVLLREQSQIVGPLGSPHAYKFNSGVIGLRPSDACLEFVRRYCDDIQGKIERGEDIDRIYEGVYTALDQEYLYVLYKEMEANLEFQSLDTSFNDSEFKPGSVVWHGKGNTRTQFVYKREKAYYDGALLKFVYYSSASFTQTLLRSAKKVVKSIVYRGTSAKAAA